MPAIAGVTPDRLTASEAAKQIRAGTLTVEALARAWSYVDPDAVVRQARELDEQAPRSPLHGIPIGVKDMIDTRDIPTQHNSPIF